MQTVTSTLVRKLALPGAVMVTAMFATFLPTGAENVDSMMLTGINSVATHQASAHLSYLSTRELSATVSEGEVTSPIFSSAYVDAVEVVAPYNSSLVVNNSGLIVGLNSPTKEIDKEHAYVVNVVSLLEEELEDIIQFEQQTLGVSGHATALEYAKEKLPIRKSITKHYGEGSRNVWYGAVGPAVTIRDFYSSGSYSGSPTNAAEYFKCFGGAANAYLDAMLVKEEDVDAYLAGENVNVVYAQFRMYSGNCKAHSAPWGITQTYFQLNAGGTMQPNTSMGGFTSTSLGTTPITGQGVEDLTSLWSLAEQYGSIYWWPTILATRENLTFATTSTLTGVTSSTANIFECFETEQFEMLQNQYAGYSLVGILVYAIQ